MGTDQNLAVVIDVRRTPAVPTAEQARAASPCFARANSAFVHLDGSCQCFFGGPAPEFAAARLPVGAFLASPRAAA